MRILLIFITIFYASLVYSQDHYKDFFNEEFNSNSRNWDINNKQLNSSKINEGKLIHWFGEQGYSTANLSSVYVNENKPYAIRFSIANINNRNGYKYQVYEKKRNGKLKDKWIDNPIWGFIWGYKDWDNYNSFILQKTLTSYGTYHFSYKIYSVVNGQEIVRQDWKEDTKYIFTSSTSKYEFIIEQANYGFAVNVKHDYIINGELADDETTLCYVEGYTTKWYGSYIGPYIGAGAKINIDYIKIGYSTPCRENRYSIRVGNRYALKGNYFKAIELYSKTITSGCVYPNLYLKRAAANYSRGYFSSSKEDCSLAISLDPTNEDAFYMRALCKIELNDKTALEDLKKGGTEGIMLLNELKNKSENSNNSKIYRGTGSGLIISQDGYIVTNEHVVEIGNNISVDIIEDGEKKTYYAKLIKVDKVNDLALIKIVDDSFIKFKEVPYGVRTFGVRVGESVFSMGYPQVEIQGEEIKITDGIISSKTGYKNDVTSYQISAPIQPGNSGGPLFDKKGNLIGITNAGITESDNVGYAIKASYLMNFLEIFENINLNFNNKISDLSFPDLIAETSSFVVLIHVNNE